MSIVYDRKGLPLLGAASIDDLFYYLYGLRNGSQVSIENLHFLKSMIEKNCDRIENSNKIIEYIN